MKDDKGRKDIPLEALVQELRARELPQLKQDGLEKKAASELDQLDTAEIFEQAFAQQKVIYGVDDRRDLFAVSDQDIRDSADAVVSLWGGE